MPREGGIQADPVPALALDVRFVGAEGRAALVRHLAAALLGDVQRPATSPGDREAA